MIRLFARPLTPTGSGAANKSGLFKIPQWLRGKNDGNSPTDAPPQIHAVITNRETATARLELEQSEEALTPITRIRSITSTPPPLTNLPPLLQSPQYSQTN